MVGDRLPATQYGDYSTRELAADNLGKAKPPTPAVMQALIRTLGDRSSEVRTAACEGLEDLGPAAAEALPTLRKLAASDRDDWVRRAATGAIERIAPQ